MRAGRLAGVSRRLVCARGSGVEADDLGAGGFGREQGVVEDGGERCGSRKRARSKGGGVSIKLKNQAMADVIGVVFYPRGKHVFLCRQI